MAVRVKVKTTVIDTGQEYLLLVAKMNLKGILVNTSQILKPNTQLMLELKFNEQSPLMLKGYVHKVSEESSTKKGMVIAFLNPSEEAKQKIKGFINDSKEISSEARADSLSTKRPIVPEKKEQRPPVLKKTQPIEKKEKISEPSKKIIQQEKTMIVGDEEIPTLSLSSPDNNSDLSFATMDEESMHAISPGMAGNTRNVNIGTRESVKKKKPFRLSTVYRAFAFVLVIIFIVLIAKPVLKFMDVQFGQKNPIPTANNQIPNNPQAPSTENSNTLVAGFLDSVKTDDQGGFLKISLLGKGNFANNTISKTKTPKGIHIELAEISGSNALPTTTINNDPITNVNVTKNGDKIAVDILFYERSSPEYEAKVYPNAMDIFFYR